MTTTASMLVARPVTRLQPSIRKLAVLLALAIVATEGWTAPPPPPLLISRLAQTAMATLTIVTSTVSFDTTVPPPTETLPHSLLMSSTLLSLVGAEEDLLGSLRPPSEDQPQIPLPTIPASLNNKNKAAVDDAKVPIVQALLYLADPNVRPGPLDTIVVTVRDGAHPEQPPLAGARFPVSQVRLPTNLRLFPQNVFESSNTKAVVSQLQTADRLLVQAVVCPQDSASIPCRPEEQTLQAQGVAKLIVTNLAGENGFQVRSAASLALH